MSNFKTKFLCLAEKITVIIVYNEEDIVLRCSTSSTLAQVREQWHLDLGATPSVCFFKADGRFLTDSMTVAEVLEDLKKFSLELHAMQISTIWLQVFGFEATKTLFQSPLSVAPSIVRRPMISALGVQKTDFRLVHDNEIKDQSKSFHDLGISEGDLLTLDLRMTVILRGGDSKNEPLIVNCFMSDTIGELRHQLRLPEDQVLVRMQPSREVLSNSARICDMVDNKALLDLPVDLLIERKVELFFQPSGEDQLRQKMLVPLSLKPLALYDEVSERFQMYNEFHFILNSVPLRDDVPLIEQNVSLGMVIHIEAKNLSAPDTQDYRKRLSFLSCDEIKQKSGWPSDFIMDVAPLRRANVYKELFCRRQLTACKETLQALSLTEEVLVSVEPLKVIGKLKKRLRLCRLPQGSTFYDVRTYVEQALSDKRKLRYKQAQDEAAVCRKSAPEMVRLKKVKEFQTQLEVTVERKSFKSFHKASEVTFTDVMHDVGKQMKVRPQKLFQYSLFCDGCGRSISKEEEEFQSIPLACCRVRSLKLTARRNRGE